MVYAVILDPSENIICWLNPEFVDIDETIEEGKIRSIKLSHPINDDYKAYPENWYYSGNKIWIPTNGDFESCLYVINNSYAVKYGSGDIIEINAEEVLVELNYVPGWFYATLEHKTITKDWLKNVFGDYFTIGTFETPNTTDIYPVGSMNLMSLLRQIESESGNIFTTEYYKADGSNKINRVLNFMNPSSLGTIHNKLQEIIEIGHNTTGVNYTIDESDCFTAIQPILSSTSTTSNGATTGSTSSSDDSTVDETSVATLRQAMLDWLNLEVAEGENIPMIVQKDSEGNPIYTSYWNAPYPKHKGDWFVATEGETHQDYTSVIKLNGDATPKIGTVSTSDTDKYAIYNDCANKLREKSDPSVKIEANVTDLQILTGEQQTYKVYDIVYLKVPNYDKLIRARVTKTSKNLRNMGSNKITITSNPTEAYEHMIATTSNLTMQQGTTHNFKVNVVDGRTKQPLEDASVTFYVSKLVTVTEGESAAGGGEVIPASTTVQDWVNKATSSTNAKQVIIDCAIYIKKNVSYEYYKNFRHEPESVISRRKANCCDGARLLATMCATKGVILDYIHIKNGAKGHVFNRYNGEYVDWLCMRSSSNWGQYTKGYGDASTPAHTSTHPTLPF